MNDEQMIALWIMWIGSMILLTYFAIDIKSDLQEILRRENNE